MTTVMHRMQHAARQPAWANEMGVSLGPIKQIVLQPTPFCNLACRYCYLPDKDNRGRMKPEIAALALYRVFESERSDHDLELRWHAGEPLVVPADFYRKANRLIREITPSNVSLRQTLQTNAVLLDDAWCDVFEELDIEVGVSIDGPAFLHDAHRHTRNGRSTHAAVMAGCERLHARGIPFTVIAVVTEASLGHAQAIHRFFADLGPTQVGLNLEESDGAHTSAVSGGTDVIQRYADFLAEFRSLCGDGSVKIREFESMRDAILSGGEERRSITATPAGLLCVDWRGRVSGFSPELQGLRRPLYGDFIFGHVETQTLEEMFESYAFRNLTRDISAGVTACRQSCSYFGLCGGGSPSNKLGEHGSFIGTSTVHCTAHIKLVADMVLIEIEKELYATST